MNHIEMKTITDILHMGLDRELGAMRMDFGIAMMMQPKQLEDISFEDGKKLMHKHLVGMRGEMLRKIDEMLIGIDNASPLTELLKDVKV